MNEIYFTKVETKNSKYYFCFQFNFFPQSAKQKKTFFFAFSFFFSKTYNFHPDSKIDISFFCSVMSKPFSKTLRGKYERRFADVYIMLQSWYIYGWQKGGGRERPWHERVRRCVREQARERASERESEREKERVGVCFSFSILLITPSNVAPFILSDDTKKFWNKKTSLRLMLVFCFLSEVIMLVLWLSVSGFISCVLCQQLGGSGCSTGVERTPHDREVVGSNPTRCWAFYLLYPLRSAS